MSQSGATRPSKSGIEEELGSRQSASITGTSPSDC